MLESCNMDQLDVISFITVALFDGAPFKTQPIVWTDYSNPFSISELNILFSTSGDICSKR